MDVTMEEDKKKTPNTFRPGDGIKPLPKPDSRATKSEQVPFEMELQEKEQKDLQSASEQQGKEEEETSINTFRPSDGIKPLEKPEA